IYDSPATDTLEQYKAKANALVEALLLVGEAQLSSSISGTSGFAEDFQRRGMRDSSGRSLRDLDLQRRLFKYPLSYVVYSREFDNLPTPARNYVCRRIIEVLQGIDPSRKLNYLSKSDRQAILQILKETKPDVVAASQATIGR